MGMVLYRNYGKMRMEHFVKYSIWQKKDEQGHIVGIWGAMSDFSYSFKPWEENYTKGGYTLREQNVMMTRCTRGVDEMEHSWL